MPTPDAPYTYEGSELELFAGAACWKRYVARQVGPFLGRAVLEVGAGLGGMTRALDPGRADRWVGLEPDPALAARFAEAVDRGELPAHCRAIVGTLERADGLPPFDTILYMDVLEHIDDDRAEVARAAGHLRPGGHLIALAPAHDWLATPFDAAIGHRRRYDRRSLRAAASDCRGLELVRLRYLDAAGIVASLGNRLVLRQSMPTARQIALWDRALVRLSRLADPLLGYRLGKSILGVWRRRGAPADSGNRSKRGLQRRFGFVTHRRH